VLAVRLRASRNGLLIEHGAVWVNLKAALDTADVRDDALAAAGEDVLSFLRADDEVRARVRDLLADVADDESVADDPGTAGIPFAPRSMRAFMLWETHVVQSSRMLVKRFFPPPARLAVGGFERVTRRTFPKLRPNARFREAPTFYLANHTMLLADRQEMWWPSHTKFLDFELELACVLRGPLVDATPEQAREAVGGWFVLNDWSARDVQADDARRNVFGPVIKSKTFANSIGSDVVTADEFGDWKRATGRVRVDGELWCEGATAGPAHDIGEMLAYASAGERLDAGDVISTGTMPGCCGLELDRWIRPGQTVELEIDGIGTLSNRISQAAAPATALPS
jgi:2-keto-4-pentenoate hydratase/2-oxohepta-3-ene-1,7-dioic acid hydratase in catechol pathway